MKKSIILFIVLLLIIGNISARRIIILPRPRRPFRPVVIVTPRPRVLPRPIVVVKPKKILPRAEFLGSKIVNFKSEKDVIWVTESEGRFRKIMFKVSGNAIKIHKLIIIYGNGNKDVIPVKLIFKQGDWSRIIDLRGKRREIRKIAFFYRSAGPLINGRAEIKVFGIH